MFEHLQRAISWKENVLPDQQLILLLGSQINGDFLLHHFLSMCQKCQYKMCFVSIAQTFAHYAQAGNKIGNCLDKAKLEEDLLHIDLMENWFSSYINQSLELNLKDIYVKILNQIKQFKAKKDDTKCAIILDDLSIFCHLGNNYFEIYQFVKSLTSFCKGLEHCIVIVALNNMSNKNEDICQLSNSLFRLAETIAEVVPLKSGYSKDVHGQLNLKYRNYVTGTADKKQEYHYKLSDKSLSLFAKGTSSAVL